MLNYREHIEKKSMEDRKYDPSPWLVQEIHQLKDDLKLAKTESALARLNQDRAEDRAGINQRKYQNLERDFNEKVNEKNHELMVKSMIYLDLIKEYERIIPNHPSNKIIDLRKRGGLQV